MKATGLLPPKKPSLPSSSNEEQASELGQIRLPGVFGGPGADIKLLILSHISGKPAI